MPELVIAIDGEVTRVVLEKERTTLGRRSHNDIVIDSMAISGEHAAFIKNGGYVLIEDLKSTNGTYVNGELVRIKALEENDLIEINECRILFHGHNGTAPAGAHPFERRPGDTASTESDALAAAADGPHLRALPRSEGQDVVLQKVVTTVGRPGVAVAMVTRRREGYMVANLVGSASLNGVPLTADPVGLNDGDVVELDGLTRLEFRAGVLHEND